MTYHLINEFQEIIGFEIKDNFVVRVDFNPLKKENDIPTEFSEIVKKDLSDFLSRKTTTLDFPTRLQMTSFQNKVIHALRLIPYGKTVSYQDIANLVGKPNAARAVGNACANNPIPIYYPCHRVIKKNGDLGGFSGGEGIKKWLLSLENSIQICETLTQKE